MNDEVHVFRQCVYGNCPHDCFRGSVGEGHTRARLRAAVFVVDGVEWSGLVVFKDLRRSGVSMNFFG